MRALEAAEFASQANVAENLWRKVFLKRSAHVPIAECALPAGITIRPLAAQGEVEAYVQLHRSAFGSTNMLRASRRRVLERAEYIPDLDLVAVTEAGRLAAFCIGWFTRLGWKDFPAAKLSRWVYRQISSVADRDARSSRRRCDASTITALRASMSIRSR